MSQHNPAFSPLAEMEDDVLAVTRWAAVLNHIGSSNSSIDPATVWVISNVLRDVGKRLAVHWDDAFKCAGGKP